MTHQISLPNDIEFIIVYLTAVMILVGVLLFAVQVREIAKEKAS